MPKSVVHTIRKLRPGDDRSAFRSGNIDLDRFLQKFAGQNQFRKHIGVTFVAIDEQRIVGYLTVSAGSIRIQDLPKRHQRRLPEYPLPVLRVARLAVDQRCQGQGLGSLLLRHAIVVARQMADAVGCLGVVVDAKEEAVSFYARYGFVSFALEGGWLKGAPRPTSMFLALAGLPKKKD